MHFADKLRLDYKGHNDLERLKNWKEINNDYKNSISLEDIETVVESQLSRLTIDNRTGEVNLE